MKKFTFYIFLLILGSFFFAQGSYAQNVDPSEGSVQPRNQSLDYNSLVPLPGVQSSISADTDVSFYLMNIVKVVLGFAIALATFMVLYGGVRMATTDAFTTQSEGKKTIQEALKGLAIALGAFIILNTISPSLVNFNFSLPGVNIPAAPATPAANQNSSQNSSYVQGPVTDPNCPECSVADSQGRKLTLPCPDCVLIDPNEFAIKEGACRGQQGTSGCKMSEPLRKEMLALRDNAKTLGLDGKWRITEGWPSTVYHNSAAQKAGRGIDINALENNGSSGASPEFIAQMIKASEGTRVGLSYEYGDGIKTSAARTAVSKELIKLGYTQTEAATIVKNQIKDVGQFVDRTRFVPHFSATLK